MIRVTVELCPHGDKEHARVLGTMEIANVGGDMEVGEYDGILHAEYTPQEGRRGHVKNFRRRQQSVWSLVGGFLKLWGHTKHSPKDMSK